MKRGYDKQTVSMDIGRAGALERNQLLTYKEKSKSNRIPLIVTFNKNLPNLNQIINSTWDHLMINPPMAAKFP